MSEPFRPASGPVPGSTDGRAPDDAEPGARPAPDPAPGGSRREPPSFPDDFVPEPTRDLEAWARVWREDLSWPIRSDRGVLGKLVVAAKRLLRPVARAALADQLDRQRAFNQVFLENFAGLRNHVDALGASHQAAIEAHARRMEEFDVRLADGMSDVMRHDDALFALLDQKLDRFRRETRELWGRLDAVLAAGPGGGSERAGDASGSSPGGESDPGSVAASRRRVRLEQGYLALEERWRGSEEEIAARFTEYLPLLRDRGPVLDLGCGRGEALRVLAGEGIEARGVDASSEMVERCREQGLDVVEGDLVGHLAEAAEGSLGAVVSFHVIEHLPAEVVDRLVRLARRALRPGGALILETPSPLSLRMAAREFWIDPTHVRPVHPASLEVLFREAGFEPVHRLDLHPFGADQRLPEIDPERVPEDQKALVHEINRLRDLLDDLIHGSRDFAMVGVRP